MTGKIIENLKMFCPYCGKIVECFFRSSNSSMGIYHYRGNCKGCERDMFIEDRSSCEQLDEVELVLC